MELTELIELLNAVRDKYPIQKVHVFANAHSGKIQAFTRKHTENGLLKVVCAVPPGQPHPMNNEDRGKYADSDIIITLGNY